MAAAPSIAGSSQPAAVGLRRIPSVQNPRIRAVFNRSLASIHYEPITLKGLIFFNPRLFCIYTDEEGKVPAFIAVAQKTSGCYLGAIYEERMNAGKPSPIRWMGKVGDVTGFLRDDPDTKRRRQTTRREINLDAIREKLAYDLYQELGRDFFQVPKNCLSLQKIMNPFTEAWPEAWHFVKGLQIEESLWVMSQFVEGYHDLAEAETVDLDGKTRLSFMTFIEKYRRPPENIFSSTAEERKENKKLKDKLVPLRGIVELLAVGKALADVDFLGGKGTNSGFTWVVQDQEIIAAQVVKVDPGYAFHFSRHSGDETSVNLVINTRERVGNPRYWLQDQKDIQTSTSNSSTIILWRALTEAQQETFLSTLINIFRYQNNDKVLSFLFWREGRFYCSDLEQLPKAIADTFTQEMSQWLGILKEIYASDLQAYAETYPEEILRIQYLDRYGELPLPTSEETFPIRELFTETSLIERKKADAEGREQPELPESDSLLELHVNLESPTISLEELFSKRGAKKVLLVGKEGSGKSALCQKAIHDWASGTLWQGRFKAVYWFPLRLCNAFVEKETVLTKIVDAEGWLGRVIGTLILSNTSLIGSFQEQIRQHKKEILFVFEGLDEASPALARIVDQLLGDPELTILLTSRPGATTLLHNQTDCIVENVGFSDDQLIAYTKRFFQRKGKASDSEKQQEAFITALKANPHFFSLAHVPLQLQMLCSLWEEGTNVFPSTLTALYGEMVHLYIQWHYQKLGKTVTKEEVYLHLGNLALWGLQNEKRTIPKRTVQFPAALKKDLLATGLLKETEQSGDKGYYFVHLTFQEFLAAWCISRQSVQDQQQFVLDNRYKPQFQLVLSFLAGIISVVQESLERTKDFFRWLHGKGADLTGFYQYELVIRCLNECSDPLLQNWVYTAYPLKELAMDTIPGLPDEERHRWLSQLFKYYPIAVSPIWEGLWQRLESKQQLSSAIEALTVFGEQTPEQYVDRIVRILIQTLNPGILGKVAQTVQKKKFRRPLAARALAKVAQAASEQMRTTTVETLMSICQDIAAKKSPKLSDADFFDKMADALEKLGEGTEYIPLGRMFRPEGRPRAFLPEEIIADFCQWGLSFAKEIPQEVTAVIPICLQTLKDRKQSDQLRCSASRTLGMSASFMSAEESTTAVTVILEMMETLDKGSKLHVCVSEALDDTLSRSSENRVHGILDILFSVLLDKKRKVDLKLLVVKALVEGAASMSKPLKFAIGEFLWGLLIEGIMLLETNKEMDVKTFIKFLLKDREIEYFLSKFLIKMAKVVSEPRLTIFINVLLKYVEMGAYPTSNHAGKALGHIAKRISREKISEIFQALSQIIADNVESEKVCFSVIGTLGEIAQILTLEQIHLTVEVLYAFAQDQDFARKSDSYRIAEVLVTFAEVSPGEEIPVIVSALLLLREKKENRYLGRISLNKYLSALISPKWEAIAPILIDQAIQRKCPLFIRFIDETPHLCTQENNQLIDQPMTNEQLDFFRRMCISDAPLNLYTSSYL